MRINKLKQKLNLGVMGINNYLEKLEKKKLVTVKFILGIMGVFCLVFLMNLGVYGISNIGILKCMLISAIKVSFLFLSCISFLMLISAISYCFNRQQGKLEAIFSVVGYLIFFCGFLCLILI